MANHINTTKVGDDFESKSLDIIRKLIEEEQLGYLTNHIKIFQKKEYYSNLRKKNIKFDLTIEVWPPGANRYVLLYIIECKDHDERVPVNKIEDFHSKILQVAGVNVKGIFISNSPLQKGGLNFAESVGMMVIQGESSEDYKIILHKRNASSSTDQIPIITQTIDKNLIDTGVEHIEKLLDKKIYSAFKMISNDTRISYGIDRLSGENIEIRAHEELDKIDKMILTEGRTLNPKKLSQYLENSYGIKLIGLSNAANLLGLVNINDKVIGINRSIIGSNRELFVMAHEFGHYLLHKKLSIGQILYDSFEDSEHNFKTGKNDLNNPRQWIEWQANHFASALLLPKAQFLARVWWVQNSMNKPKGKIYLDDQYDNVMDFNKLAKKLAYIYSVSKTSIIYKLREMDLINNQSRLKSIGQIIEEYKSDLFM